MKKSIFNKKLLVALCAVVGAVVISVTSVLGTIAYLTSSAAVSNVFTVGNVGIKMTESKVNADGKIITGEGAAQVDTNTYHLIPGKTYDKNPTIFVDDKSEDSFLFVLVRNDLEDIAPKDNVAGDTDKKTIAEQLAENGWAKYVQASTGWVYVYVGCTRGADGKVTSTNVPNDGMLGNTAPVMAEAGKSYLLFSTFSVSADADVSRYGAAKITLTAVAIQNTGFDNNVNKAWEAVKKDYPYIHTGETPGTSTPGTSTPGTGE